MTLTLPLHQNMLLGASLDQLKYRWRYDDNNEALANWVVAEDTSISVSTNDRRRVRIMIDATGDPNAFQGRLQFRRKDVADSWRDVELEE